MKGELKLEKENDVKQKRKNRKEKKVEVKSVKEKKPKVLRQSYTLLPFLKTEDGLIHTRNGYMEILQIETTDLYSKNNEELKQLLYQRSGFLRSFNDSFKEVIMNFPVDASVQRQYWIRKMEKTDDPIRLKFIQRKLFEFDFLEKERTNREFFIFLYAETKERLNSAIDQVKRSKQNSFPVQVIDFDKKQDVLFLLNNQNTKLVNK